MPRRSHQDRIFDAIGATQHMSVPTIESAGRLVSIGSEEERRPDMGFILRMMVLCSLPHTDRAAQPGEVLTRTNGRFTLCLEPKSGHGVPYGIYPRLIMAYLTQEVQRTKRREVSLGRSLSGFMEELGITPNWGKRGTVAGLREQMERLFGSRIWLDEKTGRFTSSRQAIFADNWLLWWDPRPQGDGRQDDLFESTVTLGEKLYAEMLANPIPFDKRVIREIKDSPLAVDLYWWLGMRAAYLQEPIAISWEQLAAQLGADYARPDLFAQAVKKQLRRIRWAWPDLKIETPRGRLKLYPSPPHVPKLVKGDV